MASSSSSTSLANSQFKYDVFLSFRGEDTRKGFTSHLYAALCRKSINTFIDNDLLRGEEIADALWRTIEESKIAVVIFSKNYAASKWCLDELAKIIECHQNHGKLVIPIFYHVDPSDVRKQTGNFANAITRHVNMPVEKVHMWKAALTAAANLSGWASQDVGLESKFVEEISKDIFKKLNQTSSRGLERLVGMESRIKQMMDLLSLGSSDVRMVGIWGMGGIGKTTIATAIFQQFRCDFDGACFLQNVRENSEQCNGLASLAKKLVLEIAGDGDFKISIPHDSIQYMLRGRKVLIILDDVNKTRQLEVLAGDPNWFGSGSRIIITSRDKQVFKRYIDNLYQVNELTYSEALQLFSWNAFKQDCPIEGLMVESEILVKYANGNPLALKVLGSSLFGKSKEEWESAVKKLEKNSHVDIQEVLKLSYIYLDPHDKQIFLHIACFFKGESQERVVKLLDSCGFSSKIGISNLIDKSLVISLGVQLGMHDLVQQMGRAIVHEESNDPSKRSRLWDHQDIYQIFKRNTGSEAIEGISLDMSNLTRELNLEPDAFDKMPNLKLLKFYVPLHSAEGFQRDHYKVKLGQGLESFPSDLRYLEWHGYPLKTLPANFDPEYLCELHLPNSAIESLWDDNKNSEKLVRNDSSHSQSLIKAPPQAQSHTNTVLEGLYNFISGISHLKSLACMHMKNHKTIQSLPNDFVMPSLEILDVSGCSKLKRFPLLSMNLEKLHLNKTAIVEVPSSIECLRKLQFLDMKCCSKVKNLPNTICKLKSLKCLNLNDCSNLKDFPDILEPMEHLSSLQLSGTAIEKLPPSIEHLTRLEALNLKDCKSLVYLPESLSKLGVLHFVSLSKCPKLELLSEDNHNLLKKPFDLACLSQVTFLQLKGLNFEQLPQGLNQASQLEILRVKECNRLRSLSELPLSLKEISLKDCLSLETVTALKPFFELPQNAYFDKDYQHVTRRSFSLTNCFKLDHNAWSVSGEQTHQKMQRYASAVVQKKSRGSSIRICYPGSEIPNWITYQTEGSSIRILAQPDWNRHSFLGFAFCAVVDFKEGQPDTPCHGCEAHFDFEEEPFFLQIRRIFYRGSRSEHVLLWYEQFHDERFYTRIQKQWQGISFTFTGDVNHCKVKKWGVLPLFSEEEEELSGRGEEEEEEEEGKAMSNNKRCRGFDDNTASGETEKDEEEAVAVPCTKKPKQSSYHMEDH